MANRRVIVLGAGAGGMMAAGRAAETEADMLLLEKSDRPGKKVLISGNARCNLSNARELDDFVIAYGKNGQFLQGAFRRFFRDDLVTLLRRRGLETNVDQDGRIFPASDNARDVVRALERHLAVNKVKVRTGAKAVEILVDDGRVTGVRITGGERFHGEAVILSTGGASYPETGSTGDGYRMAEALGHTIVKLRPALVPLAVREAARAVSMQGVSLRDVRLTAFQCPAEAIDLSLVPRDDAGRGIRGRRPRFPVIESRRGEMMMTHFGIGGPITLMMSLAIVDALENGTVSVSIDLEPALDAKQLREKLQRDFDRSGKRRYRNILMGLLPRRMVDPFIEMTGTPAEKAGNQLSAEERERLSDLLKSLRFTIKRPLPMAAAMVTAGGVSLKEIDPRTMASRLVKGLYFCGEVMDIDADTGGFNLQAAFSTGFVAGESAAAFAAQE